MNKDEMIKELYEDIIAIGETAEDVEEIATYLCNLNYRKVADDEIVVKKSKIGMLEKTIDYLEMEKAQLNKQLEQAEQEMSREILQELYDEATSYVCKIVELTAFQIEQRAKEKGIELEKDNEQRRNV